MLWLGVNVAEMSCARLGQAFQEEPVILLIEKNPLSIVAAVDEVLRLARQNDSERSWHAYMMPNSPKTIKSKGLTP